MVITEFFMGCCQFRTVEVRQVLFGGSSGPPELENTLNYSAGLKILQDRVRAGPSNRRSPMSRRLLV